MTTSHPVPVVCAIIERNGMVLLAQRPAARHLGGHWEFPGGKVESGETPPAALIREIREELGADIVLGRALPRHPHHYDHLDIELIPFVCTLAAASAEPAAHEHAALAWVRPSELTSNFLLAPADVAVAHDFLTPASRHP